MPQLQVTFRAGTKAQYDALQTKDEGCLYFLTDKNMIYRGNVNVTSRYLIGAVQGGIRITDQATGAYYDIPMLSTVTGWLENNLVLHFSPDLIETNTDLLRSIEANIGEPATGKVEAGTVWRVESKEGSGVYLNPGQFAEIDISGANLLYVDNHDLIVALYKLEAGQVIYDDHSSRAERWESNHQLFAVIPTDLVNLVTAPGTLDANKVILGNGGKSVKAMAFGTSGQVLRMNQGGNGVEWVTPETVQNVVYWESIGE